jgi:uncharacterized membrane protein
MRRILIVLLVFLSACAPVQLGGGAFSPLQTDDGVATLPGPGVWFVKLDSVFYNVPLSAGNQTFKGEFSYSDIRVGAKKTKGVDWVKLENPILPELWGLELARQEATRNITDVLESGGSKDYSYRDGLGLILKITVPNDAVPGAYPLTMQLKSVNSSEVGFALMRVVLKGPDAPKPE